MMAKNFIVLIFLYEKVLAFDSPMFAGCVDLNPWGPLYRQDSEVPFYVSSKSTNFGHTSTP